LSPPHDWEHGHLAYDPYRIVTLLRYVTGYHGNDCSLCPARELCVKLYDRLVNRVHNRSVVCQTIMLTRPFPCGLVAYPNEEVT